MRFAFETVVWGRRLDDVEYVLDVISACGYQGVEFAQSPDQIRVRTPSHPEGSRPVNDIWELLELLEKRNLELVSLAGGTLKQRMDFCQSYRPPYLYMQDMGGEELEAMKMPSQFTLAIHPHWFTTVRSASRAALLLEEYHEKWNSDSGNEKRLTLILDSAHLFLSESNPLATLKHHVGHLAALHLKDWNSHFGRYSQRYAQGFVPLGEGIVPISAMLDNLDHYHFQGWVVVEPLAPQLTPAEHAHVCAHWLAQNGRNNPPDTCRVEQLKSIESRAVVRVGSQGGNHVEFTFLKRILGYSALGRARFYKAVSDSVLSLCGVEVVKLFVWSPHSNEFHLLSASAAKSLPWKTSLDASTGLALRAARDMRVEVYDLSVSETAAEFEDELFLREISVCRMINVPIANHSNPHQIRFLLQLFHSSEQLPCDLAEFERIGCHVSQQSDHVLDAECSAASVEASYNCGNAKTRREFLSVFVTLLKRKIGCEAVSVFLVNQTNDHLELLAPEASTGVEWLAKVPLHEQLYRRGENETGLVWSSGEIRTLSETRAARELRDKCIESGVTSDRMECLFAPMAQLGGEVVGVVRMVNKIPSLHSPASTMFTDDDIAVLDSIVQSALPHLEQLLLKERQLEAISRMTHEFQVPLVAIRSAANMMQHSFSEKKIKPSDIFEEDYLGDVIEWGKLMGRLANNARVFSNRTNGMPLSPTQIYLLKDVIAPSVAQVRMLLSERRFSKECIRVLNFGDVPKLWLDKNQFQQVFFNLLSNAIKYGGGEQFRIEISGGQYGNSYSIWFADWGPGIDHGMEEVIFEPGYRGREAMKKDVAGQGIGLFVVKSIIEAHGGTIKVVSPRKPLNFQISLPMSLRLPPSR